MEQHKVPNLAAFCSFFISDGFDFYHEINGRKFKLTLVDIMRSTFADILVMIKDQTLYYSVRIK